MVMIRRGDVWWVDYAEPLGSEPGYRHPALVIQRDEVNASAISTITVCLITSNTRLAEAPGNTLLKKRVSGLPRDSVVNASQVSTIDRADLIERVSTLPAAVMRDVDDGLRWFLRLD